MQLTPPRRVSMWQANVAIAVDDVAVAVAVSVEVAVAVGFAVSVAIAIGMLAILLTAQMSNCQLRNDIE